MQKKRCKHTYCIDRRRIDAVHSHLTKYPICYFGHNMKKIQKYSRIKTKMTIGIIFGKKNNSRNPPMAIWMERESVRRAQQSALKMEDRHGCQRKAGKTTTGHYTHTPQPFSTKQSRKTCALTSLQSKRNKNELFRSITVTQEALKVHQSWDTSAIKSPAKLNALPFPRFIRHLKLLPSSESLAFDWRSLHLPRAQVMHESPTPSILNTY